jgi:RNA 3'-terminal phosphate cyclase-like protein
VTNGSRIEVSETGTSLTFVPGLLVGGRVEQECPPDRCVGYYMEPLLALGPFCKAPLHVTLTGVTNNQADPSVDLIRASTLPVLKRFLLGKLKI